MLRVAEHFERTDTGRQRRGNEDALLRARAAVRRRRRDGRRAGRRGRLAASPSRSSSRACPTAPGSVEERLRARVARGQRAHHTSLAQADDERAGHGHDAHRRLRRRGRPHGRPRRRQPRSTACATASFERLTDDHSLVEELVRQGKLTPEEADEHPQRSIITRALGAEAGGRGRHASPGRRATATSTCSARDGLTVDGPRGRRRRDPAPRRRRSPAAGRALIDAANEAGGRDNITVVLFRLEEVARGRGRAAGRPPSTGAVGAARAEPRRRARRAAAAPPAAATAPPRAASRAPPRRGAAPRASRRRRRRASPVGPILAVFARRLRAPRRLLAVADRLLRRHRRRRLRHASTAACRTTCRRASTSTGVNYESGVPRRRAAAARQQQTRHRPQAALAATTRRPRPPARDWGSWRRDERARATASCSRSSRRRCC